MFELDLASLSPILILPLTALVVAQLSKFFIHDNGQRWHWKSLFSYSGMPSGHSALMVSLVTIVALVEGIGSTAFAISLILAIIVIRDALGIRRYLGQHGKTLNLLVRDLKNDDVLEHHYPHLLERIGHSPAQVLVGSLIGLLTSLAGYLLFD